jgi:hypothetical protein
MATDHEKPRRWQFSLRMMLAAMLVIGIGLGLFVRWRLAPIVEREYRANGRLLAEYWWRRDWRGGRHFIRSASYYSNGAKASESSGSGAIECWSPDGAPVAWQEQARHWHYDNGDGTFSEPEGP